MMDMAFFKPNIVYNMRSDKCIFHFMTLNDNTYILSIRKSTKETSQAKTEKNVPI